MPSRNSLKQFDAQTMYHVYNRGNGKHDIFHDERDYAVFLSCLKYALLSDAQTKKLKFLEKSYFSEAQRFNVRRLGLAGKLHLIAFCLMPNHFHLLLFQEDDCAITKLMRSVSTGYAMYYNKKYERTGRLFEGVYKASHIKEDSYWQHISRYIHLNPLDIGKDFRTYPHSSYKYYMQHSRTDWIKPDMGMPYTDPKKYDNFLETWLPYRHDLKEIKQILANGGLISATKPH